METEGKGVRSILVRVGPTGSEFGNQMPKAQIPKILESWKYWGVLRRLHWMPGTSVARAIARVVEIPVEESYPKILEIQPGGRAKEKSAWRNDESRARSPSSPARGGGSARLRARLAEQGAKVRDRGDRQGPRRGGRGVGIRKSGADAPLRRGRRRPPESTSHGGARIGAGESTSS
jgi:hypothetical protein